MRRHKQLPQQRGRAGVRRDVGDQVQPVRLPRHPPRHGRPRDDVHDEEQGEAQGDCPTDESRLRQQQSHSLRDGEGRLGGLHRRRRPHHCQPNQRQQRLGQ